MPRGGQIARWLAIVDELQASPLGLPAERLARRHGWNARTVYRDLRGLETAGFPDGSHHEAHQDPTQRDRKTDENTYDGATIEYAEQTATLSLICLRRLRFPITGSPSADADTSARTVLAALGLAAATLAFESGMGSRSCCLLWPYGPMEWELLERPGATPARLSLTGDAAIALLKDAITPAEKVKLPWADEPILLNPSQELIKLVRLSQLEATKESGETT